MERYQHLKTRKSKIKNPDIPNYRNTADKFEYKHSDGFSNFLSSFGNQGVMQLFGRMIQAKMNISQPGDFYEKQADQIASRIASGNGKISDIATKINTIQAKSSSGGAIDSKTESQIKNLKGQGVPLSKSSRSFFEPHFGIDLGNVRVHDNNNSNKLANSLNARAFTYGNDIVFKNGEYQPNTKEGKELLGHELVHVIQQGAGVQKKDMGAGWQQAVVQKKEEKTKAKTGFEVFIEALKQIGEKKVKSLMEFLTGEILKKIITEIANAAKNGDQYSFITFLEQYKGEEVFVAIDKLFDLYFTFLPFRVPTPDGIVISAGGAGFCQYFVGGGGGVELLLTRGYGFTLFAQGGVGVGTPGGGGSVEAGCIWGLNKDSANYAGGFLEFFISGGSQLPLSGSAFYWPGGSGGIKGGVAFGSPGIGVLQEFYIRIWDCKKGWIPDVIDTADKIYEMTKYGVKAGVEAAKLNLNLLILAFKALIATTNLYIDAFSKKVGDIKEFASYFRDEVLPDIKEILVLLGKKDKSFQDYVKLLQLITTLLPKIVKLITLLLDINTANGKNWDFQKLIKEYADILSKIIYSIKISAKIIFMNLGEAFKIFNKLYESFLENTNPTYAAIKSLLKLINKK